MREQKLQKELRPRFVTEFPAKAGSCFIHGFLFGDSFDTGLTIKMGQTHVQRYMPVLLENIWLGKLKLEVIVTHRMPLSEAARGYEIFNEKVTKRVKPNAEF